MEIIPLIYHGIEKLESEKEKKIGVYYISEASKCLRQAYYSFFEKPHYPFEQHKAFSIGNALHELAQKSLALNSDMEVKNEIPDLTYKDELTGLEIHGRLDTLIKEGNKTDIIEIKTISNTKYAPITEHFEQLNYYLHFYPEAKGHLLYINKAKKGFNEEGYVEFKEIPKDKEEITYNEEMFRKIVKRMRILNEYLKTEKLPYPEAKLSNEIYWQCNFCPYRAKCDKEENEKILGKKEYEEIAKKYEKGD